jgi:cytochrome P450
MVTQDFATLPPGYLANPHPMFQMIRDQGRLVWSEAMEIWIMGRYEDVDALLMHPGTSADRASARSRAAQLAERERSEQDFGPFARVSTMLTSDPPEHTRLRRLVSKAFTPRAVENLRPRIQDIVDGLLDQAAEKGSFELVMDLAYPTPVTVIAEMLGVPPSDLGNFKRWSDAIVATLGEQTDEVMDVARTSIHEMVDYLKDFIADRRKQPRDDLISGLIAAEDEGKVLSEDEIMATTMLLLVAGNETTTHLISNATYALLQNRDQWNLLCDDPSLINSAVEELLRYDGPVMATARVATVDMEIAGGTVKEGDLAMGILAAANRDPAKFENPDKLDITRNIPEHLAFGDGIHFCLGSNLARAEAQITLGSLVKRFPNLKQESEPEWGGTFVIRGVEKMQVSV